MPVRNAIKKHQRRERDGDVVMGGAPPKSLASRVSKPTKPPTNQPLTELRVTGWTDQTESQRLLKFLERHASKRTARSGSGAIIKRSRIEGDVLLLSVRAEDTLAFSKINGFSFASTHGSQKLTITGPGIRSKSPKVAAEAAAPDSMQADSAPKDASALKSDAPVLLRGFLERRYDASEKLLNLSSIAEDDEIRTAGMFENPSRQAKFFPALMTICDQQLKTAGQKREETIQSVTLSNNNLPDLKIVRDLAFTLPHIKNLDLSGNKITSNKDFSVWKNRLRSVEHIILKDNPINNSAPGWEEEIAKLFPTLRILNDKYVNLGLTAEQQEMVAHVQQHTHLKLEMAVECLKAGEWNLEAAARVFHEHRDTLRPDAFIDGHSSTPQPQSAADEQL